MIFLKKDCILLNDYYLSEIDNINNEIEMIIK